MNSPFLPSKAIATATALAISAIGAIASPLIRVHPLPPSDWPAWAKDIAESRQPQDTGLGDTLVHVIGDERSAAFKEWFSKTFGKGCGCTARQRWLNARFPYRNARTTFTPRR